jgi:hypothetical protein
MTVTVAAGETSTADLSAYLPLLARVRNGARPQANWSALVDDAVKVWARPRFDTFLAIPRLRFEPFDYQLRAARTVLRRMRGRAIWPTRSGSARRSRPGWRCPSYACAGSPTKCW